jgi:hypothetical protein
MDHADRDTEADPYALVGEIRQRLRGHGLTPRCPAERAGMAIGAAGALIRALGFDTTSDVDSDPDNLELGPDNLRQTYDPNHFLAEVSWLLTSRCERAQDGVHRPGRIGLRR